ncbi:MAG: M28 family peptidase [bacterium]|nr:MAG: M28 family peptidase [bacterium]
MHNYLKSVIASGILLFLVYNGCSQDHPKQMDIQQNLIQIDLTELTSEKYLGREAGLDGNEQAANFISKRLQQAGLLPLKQFAESVKPEEYFQTFEITGMDPSQVKSSLSISTGDRLFTTKSGLDYHYFFNSVQRLDQKSEIVFAGYAIDAPEYDYNDFEGINIEGKVVLAFYGEPLQNDSLQFFYGIHQTHYLMEDWKARAVADRGGNALILIPTPDNLEFYTRMLDRKSKQKTSVNFILEEETAVPVIYLTADFAERWVGPWMESHFKAENQRIREELSQQSSIKLKWHAPELASAIVSLKLDYENPEVRVCRNILAMKQGTGEFDEYILVGAHYDHEGMKDGKIFPGADDNASGAIANLHIALAYAGLNKKDLTKHHIIFAFWDAEEKGTLGTRYFTDQPVIPLEKIRAVFNMDMIGRDASFNFAALRQPMKDENAENQVMLFYSAQSPGLEEFAKDANKDTGLDLLFDPNVYFTSGSDHRSFHIKQIPVIWYFTGFHTEYTSPEDTADKINFKKLTRITRHIANFSYQLANNSSIPDFDRSILSAPEGAFSR